MQLRLVNEEDGWRIDVPDAVIRQQLLDGLTWHLETVQLLKDIWPDDAKDTQRLVCAEMLVDLTDVGKAPEGGARSIPR